MDGRTVQVLNTHFYRCTKAPDLGFKASSTLQAWNVNEASTSNVFKGGWQIVTAQGAMVLKCQRAGLDEILGRNSSL